MSGTSRKRPASPQREEDSEEEEESEYSSSEGSIFMASDLEEAAIDNTSLTVFSHLEELHLKTHKLLHDIQLGMDRGGKGHGTAFVLAREIIGSSVRKKMKMLNVGESSRNRTELQGTCYESLPTVYQVFADAALTITQRLVSIQTQVDLPTVRALVEDGIGDGREIASKVNEYCTRSSYIKPTGHYKDISINNYLVLQELMLNYTTISVGRFEKGKAKKARGKFAEKEEDDILLVLQAPLSLSLAENPATMTKMIIRFNYQVIKASEFKALSLKDVYTEASEKRKEQT